MAKATAIAQIFKSVNRLPLAEQLDHQNKVSPADR
jgi:hypothetical protein